MNDSFKDFLARYLIIHPFITFIGWIDTFIGLFKNRKFVDSELPDKDAVLSALTDPNDPTSAYRSTLSSDLITVDDLDINLYTEFEKAVHLFAETKTLGTRELLSIDDEVQKSGKIFKKFSLGKYQWLTYEECHKRVENLSNGLLKLGLKSNDNIVLFSETKAEWLLSAFACFRIKVPIVTLYATLGVDALAFGINETQSRFVIVSGEQLGKIQKIIDKIPKVTNLIVLTNKFNVQAVSEMRKKYPNFTIHTMQQVEELGRNTEKLPYITPKANDLAIIMYTSGSTGNPKGVMMSHINLITSLKGLIRRLGKVNVPHDIYIAYLPLAHVLELCCEVGCFVFGVRIGYSSAQTIADTSTAIKEGEKGDLRVLKPTIMAGVPIVLERLSKTVHEKISKTSRFTQILFEVAYKKKLRYFHNDRQSRLLDKLLFKRISSAVLGGKCRLLMCGGAILNKEVHEFAQVCLCPVMQAYGLTETCAAAITQLPNATNSDEVGSVVECCEIRLVDWPEAGYRCTDKPHPRGEIYVGGNNITLGYYNLPEKTNEDYKYINGIKYFATGDIGEFVNGNFKIIDRKKDLVKLQGGEYVSLNKVESLIKLLNFVDNCCVIADPTKSYCVVLVSPNQNKLLEYIEELEGTTETLDKKSSAEVANKVAAFLEKDVKLTQQLLKEMTDHCLKHNLERFEIPAKMKFVKEAWLPETGLVTDSMKIKRKEIDNFYKSEISELYK